MSATQEEIEILRTATVWWTVVGIVTLVTVAAALYWITGVLL
jgi:hypothetical protein